MSGPRRVLVAIAGAEDPTIVAELAGLLGPDAASLEVTLLHVVDSGPPGGAAAGPRAPPRGRPPRARRARGARLPGPQGGAAGGPPPPGGGSGPGGAAADRPGPAPRQPPSRA